MEASEPRSPALDPTPGESDLRRLNSREYRHSVEDVLGIELPTSLRLPDDAINGEGFDTDGATLSMAGDAATRYYDAAQSIALQVRGTVRIETFAPCFGLANGELWECFRPSLSPWLGALFRQPVPAASIDRLVAIGTEIDVDYGSAIETLVTFALTSPYFLIHYKTPDGAQEADDYEVADRLAYLLWSSAPDAALLELAAAGQLRADLEVQADRMLADPRSDRFVETFSQMWIEVDSLDGRGQTPEESALFADLRQETLFFVGEVFRSGNLVELISADWTFANARVAAHYDLPTEGLGEEFVRVDLPAERRGLLTHGALLVARAPEGHSDPIRRGFWTAGRLVCNPPPSDLSPPSEIAGLSPAGADRTVRDLLAEHRENPYCAGCHDYTDPYGLAFETFDGAGAYRAVYDNGIDVDPSGRLPSGEVFADVYELGEVVASRGDVERCVSRYLTGYALGRGLTGGDIENARSDLEAYIQERGVDSGQLTLRDLVVRLALAPQFRNAEGAE